MDKINKRSKKSGEIKSKPEISVKNKISSTEKNDGNSSENPTNKSIDRRKPTNIFNHHSIWVGNIRSNFDKKKFNSIFSEFGRISSVFHLPNNKWVIVSYDNRESPINAIAKYKNTELEGISDGNIVMSFTPSRDYSQTQTYNKMSFQTYSSVVNREGECQYWRCGQKCPDGKECKFKHMFINKRIDPLPGHK